MGHWDREVELMDVDEAPIAAFFTRIEGLRSMHTIQDEESS